MREPHVVSLEYILKPVTGISYRAGISPLTGQLEDFHFVLSEEKLLVEMRSHFPTSEDAQRAVQPFLHAWELERSVQAGRQEFTFEFIRDSIIDLNPPDDPVLSMSVHAHISFNATVNAEVIRGAYPSVPTDFELVSSELYAVWQRFQGYRNGNERLPGLAYYCLTAILRPFRQDRALGSKELKVDKPVLSKIGELSTKRGGEGESRKVDKDGIGPPLTQKEAAWLETALCDLIRRRAIFDQHGSVGLPFLTMANLPPMS